MKLYLNGGKIASAELPRHSRLAEAVDTELLIGKNNHSTNGRACLVFTCSAVS